MWWYGHPVGTRCCPAHAQSFSSMRTLTAIAPLLMPRLVVRMPVQLALDDAAAQRVAELEAELDTALRNLQQARADNAALRQRLVKEREGAQIRLESAVAWWTEQVDMPKTDAIPSEATPESSFGATALEDFRACANKPPMSASPQSPPAVAEQAAAGAAHDERVAQFTAPGSWGLHRRPSPRLHRPAPHQRARPRPPPPSTARCSA